jgi:hypothetical protein
MINQILPAAMLRFRSKSSDYGDVFLDLGMAGQYSDMHRKMHKLKKFMWEGQRLKGEPPTEILEDLIGNALISLYLIHYVGNRNETRAHQGAASTQPSSGQDTGAQGAVTGDSEGGTR